MILVTGGLGYIGSHTVVSLLESGYEVIIVDDLSNSSLDVLDGIEDITGIRPVFHQFDLNDCAKVETLFKTHPSINGILHFAASKAVGESVLDPLKYYQNNLVVLMNLLGQIKTKINFVFSSSCTVYGQSDELPISENTPTKRPESPYGNTKKVCEEILEDYSQSNQAIRTISLRYFNPIGAHASNKIGENPKGVPQNLIPYITQSAIGRIPQLTVHGTDYPTPDGTCIRDYIHVVDLANAHVAALSYLEKNTSSASFDVFNLGTGKGSSVLEVIESFNRVSDRKLEYTLGPKRAGDIISAYASIDKATKLLQWRPKHSLDEAVLSAWNWEKNNDVTKA